MSAASAVVGLLLAAAVTNVVEYPSVQRTLADRSEARWMLSVRGEPADVADPEVLKTLDSPHIQGRRGVYLHLANHAPDAVIALPEDSRLDEASLLGLAKSVAIERYGPDTPVEVRTSTVEPYVVGTDETSRGPGPYLVAVLDEDPSRVVSVEEEGLVMIVDERLLAHPLGERSIHDD